MIQAYKENAFVFMEASDKLRTPVWVARYRQAIQAGESERDAVGVADARVRQLFPSHSAVDRSAFLRDKGMLGSLLLFQGFMNLVYNRYRGIGHDLNQAWNRGETKKVLPRLSWEFLAIGAALAMGDLFVGRG